MIEIDTKFVPITFILSQLKKWEVENHLDKTGDIIFQNKEFKLNVRFTNESLNTIKKNPRGIEYLPETIKNPDEIWARWDNVNDQKVVLMNYIITDKKHIFVVKTKGGIIQNALVNTYSNINKYRTGIMFLK